MAGYKLLTYQSETGPRAGVLVQDTVYDMAALTGQASYVRTTDVLDDWAAAFARLAEVTAKPAVSGRPLAAMTLRAPVLWPPTIYCAGANYSDHAAEMAKRQNRPPEPDPRRQGPWHFIKAARSLADPDSVVTISGRSKMMDWEAELAVVIGRAAKNVAVETALDHVAGYTIANDLSARDLSRRAHVAETSPFRADWLSHKSFDGACPLGPWIVPAADIPDPQALAIRLSVNGNVKQDSSTGLMIFSVAEQIAHLSARITLHPGDIILTGTPAGVGAARDEFLAPGDVVTITIERIGTLSNRFA
ncbi:MAG TPA: fumarylacetoacetate hydrolase family protein [Xanthobacteraceae bacterium]|nr:fumarylacetoacetate hydrolase family protein [Xanthobacteraceae bacterium]